MVYPTSDSSACLGLSMAPGNPTKLDEAVKFMKKTLQDTSIPVCAVKLAKGSKYTALEVPLWPTPASQGLGLFKGWGVVPLILNPGETAIDSEEIRKELFTFLHQCKGDNNVPSVGTYYEGPDLEWPGTERKILKTEELWPEFQPLSGEPAAAATAGKNKPRRVYGAKYNSSQKSGYSAACMSPALKGKHRDALISAANSSLSTSTWNSYSTVWKNLPEISTETGIQISFPMNSDMIQAIISFYLVRGLKASTIYGYLASIKNGHHVRGMECPALDQKLIQTVLKGAKNMESLKKAEPQGVVTIRIMKKLWTKLEKSELPTDTKRLLWAVFTLLFLGSLRPSEALSNKKTEYDEIKTLTWADVKTLSSCIDGKEVKFLQLTLKQPKTARSMPTQLVEIPELGKQICAVKAFEKWRAGRKCKQDPSTPVFTLNNGDLVTTGYINKVLDSLLSDESPKITAKAFRPGLATILAQQGATPEELKALGRWTSKAYETYIRRGRANNWRGARTQMLKATKC